MKKIWKKVVLCVAALTMLASFSVQASMSDSEDAPEELVFLSENITRLSCVIHGYVCQDSCPTGFQGPLPSLSI